jgi:DNA mismatch endonuclease (patch repair protein)
VDRLSGEARSALMSKISSCGNKSTELRFRALLIRAGIRGWCVQPRGTDGKPDFAFLTRRLAVFIDSCFWHGCPKHVRFPKSNAIYWRKKIHSNKRRDKSVTRALRKEGWTVVRIWEHELARTDLVLQRLSVIL